MSHEIFCFPKIKISPLSVHSHEILGARVVCFLSLHYLYFLLFDKFMIFLVWRQFLGTKSIKIVCIATHMLALNNRNNNNFDLRRQWIKASRDYCGIIHKPPTHSPKLNRNWRHGREIVTHNNDLLLLMKIQSIWTTFGNEFYYFFIHTAFAYIQFLRSRLQFL